MQQLLVTENNGGRSGKYGPIYCLIKYIPHATKQHGEVSLLFAKRHFSAFDACQTAEDQAGYIACGYHLRDLLGQRFDLRQGQAR